MSKKVVVQRTLDSFLKKSETKREITNVSSDSEGESIIVKRQKMTETSAAKKHQKPSHSKPPSFLSLESVINDPKSQIFKDDICICIKDKYPKSKQHFLLIPINHFTQLSDLNKSHLNILEHMKGVAKDLIMNKFEIKTKESYLIGFHSIQSMYPLHMHIISSDFVSECLKNKKHWNSFNSKYFINLDQIIDHLRVNQSLDDLLSSKEVAEKYLKSDLKCNQCTKVLSNIPKLKEHLELHQKK
jgi:aprataxin